LSIELGVWGAFVDSLHGSVEGGFADYWVLDLFCGTAVLFRNNRDFWSGGGSGGSPIAKSQGIGNGSCVGFCYHCIQTTIISVVGYLTMSSSPTLYQDAIRLLFILVHGSEKLPQKHSSGAVGLFKGETRIQAINFWVRYPDYFADELLHIFEIDGDITLLTKAEKIFEDEEPDLRRVPMARWIFGAYEKIDNALSILVSKGLVHQTGKKSHRSIQEYHYFLMPKAYSLVDEIVKEFPVLRWYDRRAKQVVQIAGNRSGTELKERQYQQGSYAETKKGNRIKPITDLVKLHLEELKNTI